MYKLTRPDGFDFYSGSINYRDAIGSTIRVTDYDPPEKGVCGRGLHASRNPNDCFVGAKLPCAAFLVKGIQPIARDKQKTRYQALKVLEEIKDLDTLFGWKYFEAINPIHPFKIKPPKITEKEISLLIDWASMWDSVGDSVWVSVRNAVRNAVRNSVWNSVGDSVTDLVRVSAWVSVCDSVGDSVGDSMWNSVGVSVRAYIGSLFPKIKKWKYIKHQKNEYPFQPAVDLWRVGLVPSFDGKIWRLHGGTNVETLWERKV